jgi:stage II sporulation protein GA (sporulation sigma-E factor processing peptidase)
MHYELYIDVFFFTNFMMDSLLLFAVRAMLRIPARPWRVFLGGMLASLATCATVVMPLQSGFRHACAYVLVPVLAAWAGLGVRAWRDFVKVVAILYVAAFLWGGILMALRPYVRAAGLFFAVSVASYYVFTGCWKLVTGVQRQRRQICEVRVFTGTGEYALNALLDTGNVLKDPVSGEMVSVIGRDTAMHIFQGMTTRKMAELGLRYIPYRTVGGEGVLPVVRVEKMCVRMGGERWITRPVIGISGQKIEERQEYQMILNPDIVGGAKNDCKSSSTTAVSVENRARF